MTDTTKLLPCPFCGSDDIDPEGWVSMVSAGPTCNDCSASAQSIEAWNRRASSAHSSDLIRRLRGEYRIPITDGLGPAGGDEPDNPKEHVRHFQTPPIQHEAARALESLSAENARLREALALISRMKLFPDDKANRTTLSAATGLARQALGDAPDAKKGE